MGKRGDGDTIRTALCFLVVLALVTVPVVAAEDDPDEPIRVADKCIKISPFDMPPVSIYDCPDPDDP